MDKVALLMAVGALGSGGDDQKELRVLNRINRHRPEGIAYEADPRHAEITLVASTLHRSRVARKSTRKI